MATENSEVIEASSSFATTSLEKSDGTKVSKLVRMFKRQILVNEVLKEELEHLQKVLLQVTREKNMILDAYIQLTENNNNSSSVEVLPPQNLKRPPKTQPIEIAKRPKPDLHTHDDSSVSTEGHFEDERDFENDDFIFPQEFRVKVPANQQYSGNGLVNSPPQKVPPFSIRSSPANGSYVVSAPKLSPSVNLASSSPQQTVAITNRASPITTSPSLLPAKSIKLTPRSVPVIGNGGSTMLNPMMVQRNMMLMTNPSVVAASKNSVTRLSDPMGTTKSFTFVSASKKTQPVTSNNGNNKTTPIFYQELN